MQVDSAAEAVAGIAYRQLRDFLKERGQYVMTAQLGEAFGLPAGDDQRLTEALITAGYLEEADELGGHPVSQKGRQLARAKFLKRMTRAQWPAAGFVDTEIRCLTELESGNAKKEVQPRVQA